MKDRIHLVAFVIDANTPSVKQHVTEVKFFKIWDIVKTRGTFYLFLYAIITPLIQSEVSYADVKSTTETLNFCCV